MKRRLLSFILAVCLILAMMPVTAFAEEGDPAGVSDVTGDSDGDRSADGSGAELSEQAKNVQALIDALPAAGEITEENKDTVKEQLDAIDGAKAELSDEELESLDIERYTAAAARINELEGQAGADEPEALAADDTEEALTNEDTIKLTSWEYGEDAHIEQYSPTNPDYLNYINVPAGTILDLSGLSVSPDVRTAIRILGDGVTIRGNQNHTFENVEIVFYGYDRIEEKGRYFIKDNHVFDGKEITLNLQNFRYISGSDIVDTFDMDSQPKSITINYKGINEVDIRTGYKNYKNILKFCAEEGAILTFHSNDFGDGSSASPLRDIKLIFDGGTVYSDCIKMYNVSSKGGLEINNCQFSINGTSAYGGIYMSRVNSRYSAEEGGTISIQKSTVNINVEKNSSNYYAGGIVVRAQKKMEIKDSKVNVSVGKEMGGIGGWVLDIVIDNSKVTVKADGVSTNPTVGAIGGECKNITIKNGSEVTAESYNGPGIGRGYQIYTENKETYGTNITMENSTVTASSTRGAGIGSGQPISGQPDAESNVTIKGNSKVVARSLYGAGIGAGVQSVRVTWQGIPLSLNPSTGGDWSSGNDVEGEVNAGMSANADTETATASLFSSPVSRAATSSTSNTLSENSGTLTIEETSNGTPSVSAESGTKAVSLPVKAETSMMEYTLNTTPSVPTAVNRIASDGSKSSYNLRPGFTSLAFWPVAADTYTLTYGSGSNALTLLDNTGEEPTYAKEYKVEDNNDDALNHFDVIPLQQLGGQLTYSSSVDGMTTDQAVYTTLNNLTPDGTKTASKFLSYQWYKNGEELTGETKSYIANLSSSSNGKGSGVYFCKVTGTGIYKGSVNSKAFTYSASSVPAPVLETATENSIQLKVPDDASDNRTYEYALVTEGGEGGLQWQESTQFTNLESNTSYSFVQRIKNSNSVSAAASFVTKGNASASAPSAKLITYNYTNETINIPSGITVYAEYDPANGTYSTEIKNGDVISAYIGKQIYIKYTNETVEDETTITGVTVPARLDAPELDSSRINATFGTITLPGAEGVQYALFKPGNTSGTPDQVITGNGEDDITFSGLANGTTYTIKARIPAQEKAGETEGYFHSFQSVITVATLKNGEKAIVVKPKENVYAYDEKAHEFEYEVNPKDIDGLEFEYWYYNSESSQWKKLDANAKPTAVGSYKVIVSRKADQVYLSYNRTFDLKIKQDQDTLSIQRESDQPETITYGAVFKLVASGGSGSGTVTWEVVSGPATIDENGYVTTTGAGEVKVRAVKEGDDTYLPAETTTTLTVKKADDSVVISDIGKIYDGQPVSVSESDYTKFGTGAVTIEYKGKEEAETQYTTTAPSKAGTYKVRVTVAEDSNYNTASAEKEFTISPREVTITGVTAKNKVYDGTAEAEIDNSGSIEGLCGDDVVTIDISNAKAAFADKNCGKDKTVSFTGFAITGNDASNYTLEKQPESATASITQKELMVDVTVKDKNYDGTNTAKIKNASLVGLVDGDDVTLTNGTPTFSSVTAGRDIDITFTTDFSISGNDEGNYKLTQPSGVKADITEYTAPAASYTLTQQNSYGWLNSEFTVTAGTGYRVSLTNTADGDWEDSLSISGETNVEGSTFTFYIKNKTTGEISTAVNKSYKIDKTAPDVDDCNITFSENSVKKFLNDISFGLFFNKTVDVKITASDGLSGIDKIYYYKSDKILTEDKVKALTDEDWKAGNQFSIEPEDKEKFIIYVKAVDKAGNVACFGSDGVEFDLTVPQITDVQGTSDGWTSTDQTISFKVQEDNLDTVSYKKDDGGYTTLTEKAGSYTFTTSETGIYTVKAVDKAGNETTRDISVQIDKTKPSVKVEGDTESICQQDKVEIAAAAGASGIAKVEVKKDNGSYEDITESYGEGYVVKANGTYTFRVINGAGVTAETQLVYQNVDTTVPVLALDSNGYDGNTWKNEGKITLSVSNMAANLGTTKFEYRIDDGGWQSYTEPIVIAEDCNAVYTFRATSQSGVTGDAVSITVKRDTKTPEGEVSISTNKWKKFLNKITFGLFFKDTQTVTIHGQEGVNESGLKEIDCYTSEKEMSLEDIKGLSDKAWTKLSIKDGKGTFDINPNQKLIIYAKIIDNAENVTYISSDGLTLDNEVPIFSGDNKGIKISGIEQSYQSFMNDFQYKYLNADQAITISADDNLSGAAIYYYVDDTVEKRLSEDELNNVEWLEYSNDVSLSEEGKYVIYAYAIDMAGNKSGYISTDCIMIDKTNPTVESVVDTEDTSATITLIGEDGESGIEGYELVKTEESVGITITQGSQGEFTITGLGPNQSYLFNYEVTDKAGNVAKGDISFTTLRTEPQFEETPRLTGIYGTQVKDLTVTQPESTNGVQGRWSVENSEDISNVGTENKYTVTFTPDDTDIYSTVTEQVIPEITAKTIKVNVSVNEKEYDGNTDATFNATIKEGILAGDKVTLDSSNVKVNFTDENAGDDILVTLDGTFSLTGTDSDNYTLDVPDGLKANITPKSIKVRADDKTKTYGEEDPELTYTPEGLIKGDSLENITVARQAGKEAGTYAITASQKDGSNSNYAITFEEGVMTITPKTIGVKWTEKELTYNGQEQKPTATADVKDIVGNDIVHVTVIGGKVDAGAYTATADGVDNPNYQLPETKPETSFTIQPKTIDKSMLQLDSTDNRYPFTGDDIQPQVNVTDTVNGSNIITTSDYTIIGDVSSLAYGTYILTVSGQKNYTGTVNIEWNITDPNVPTGAIEVSENKWNEFLNKITFGLFFKDTQTVTITGQDGENESGLKEIDYYTSEKEMSLEDIKALSDKDWKELNVKGGQGRFDIIPEQKLIIYAKLTDNSGNVTYISSDGIVLDATSPTITGVTDRETYYTTQKVTVSDANLDKVTVNGEEVVLEKGQLILAGNQEKVYQIAASDKAGNETMVIIMMKTTSSAGNDIKNITTDDVTADDKTAIQDNLNKIDELLKDDNLTEEERKELEDIKKEIGELLDKIEQIEKDIQDVTDTINGYDKDKVATDDKTTIQEALDKINELLDSNNLTEEERAVLEAAKEDAELLLAKIKEKEDSSKTEPFKPADNQKSTKPTDGSKEDTVKTGDPNNWFLWLALLAVSGGFAGTAAYRKKKNYSK